MWTGKSRQRASGGREQARRGRPRVVKGLRRPTGLGHRKLGHSISEMMQAEGGLQQTQSLRVRKGKQ